MEKTMKPWSKNIRNPVLWLEEVPVPEIGVNDVFDQNP